MSCPYCHASVAHHCDDNSAVESRLEELDAQARADAHAREWDPEDMFPDDMIDNAEAGR